MADKFSGLTESLSSPPSDLIAVTPDDATDLAQVSRALNAATAGTIRVTTREGTTGSITVAAGIIIPIRVRRIWATGTTATGIVALF